MVTVSEIAFFACRAKRDVLREKGLYMYTPDKEDEEEILDEEECDDCGQPLSECECSFETHDPDC